MRSRLYSGKQEIWFHLWLHQALPWNFEQLQYAALCFVFWDSLVLRRHLHLWGAGVRFLVLFFLQGSASVRSETGREALPFGDICCVWLTLLACLLLFLLSGHSEWTYVCSSGGWGWISCVAALLKCVFARTNAKADVDLLSQLFENSLGNGDVVTVAVEQQASLL